MGRNFADIEIEYNIEVSCNVCGSNLRVTSESQGNALGVYIFTAEVELCETCLNNAKA
jgi:hypothetical protein